MFQLPPYTHTYLPPAFVLLESELGNFCLESNGINLASRGSSNMGYIMCNFTTVFDAVWREHHGDTLIRPCNFRTNLKQAILVCDPKVGDTCMFDPWQTYPCYDYVVHEAMNPPSSFIFRSCSPWITFCLWLPSLSYSLCWVEELSKYNFFRAATPSKTRRPPCSLVFFSPEMGCPF